MNTTALETCRSCNGSGIVWGVMAMKGLNFYTYQWPEDSGEWRFIIRKGDEAVELLPDELDRLISVIVNFKKRQEEKAQKNG